MPNWCHDKLTVTGEPEPLKRFIESAANDEQPLSFNAHVPEPSPEVYAEMEERQKVKCDLCGGTGTRPTNGAEAELVGARFEANWGDMEWLKEEAARRIAGEAPHPCNGCSGSGRMLPFGGGWYGWRSDNWGCKWDASFDGPFMAIGITDEATPATSNADGRYIIDENEVHYDFQTPWGPPIPWLEKVAAQFPDLRFTLRYAEPGNDFAGEVVVHWGIESSARDLTVDEVLSSEEMWF